jgi:hypothetical protein
MAALGDWWLCSQGSPVDLVPRDFSAQQPGTKVVGDVTYASEHGGAGCNALCAPTTGRDTRRRNAGRN